MEFPFYSIEEKKRIHPIQIVEWSIYHPSFRIVGVKKYYDGSVAFYIYLVCDLAIPKFLFDMIK